jgi:molybdate transport system ATP-binding protein
MTISVRVLHRQGVFSLDANFASTGRLTALFGASGSGKTSLINMIAGLVRPGQGRIEAEGRVLVDSDAGIFVPRHKRRIGMVFQDARLFPHMSVRSNLGYGRWFTPAGERYANMNAVVELLGIGPLLDRRPGKLSGGEKQRVAIGRALLASPKLLLMDEPLASLDEARKAEILPYIERLRDETKIPIVYVSHSIAEVARLASDVVVLAQGRVMASGSAADIVQRVDLLPAEERGEGGAVIEARITRHDERFAMTILDSAAGKIHVPRLDAAIGASRRIRIRARDVMIATQRPAGLSALNVFEGTIVALEPEGSGGVEVRMDCGGVPLLARITDQSRQALELRLGLAVFAVVKTMSFDRANTGMRPGVEIHL